MKIFQINNRFIFLSSVINMYFKPDEKKITLILNKLTNTFPIRINQIQNIDNRDPKNYKIDSVLFSYDYTDIDLNEKYEVVTEEVKKFLISNDNLFSFDKYL